MPFSVGFNFFRPEVGGKDREEVSSKGETLEAWQAVETLRGDRLDSAIRNTGEEKNIFL